MYSGFHSAHSSLLPSRLLTFVGFPIAAPKINAILNFKTIWAQNTQKMPSEGPAARKEASIHEGGDESTEGEFSDAFLHPELLLFWCEHIRDNIKA